MVLIVYKAVYAKMLLLVYNNFSMVFLPVKYGVFKNAGTYFI